MSTLKVNKIRDTAGSADAIVLDPSGGAVIAGVTTVSTVKVGSGVTITSDGDIFHTGVCTATSFSGEIPAASIVGVCTSGLTRTGGFGSRTISSSSALSSQTSVTYTNFGTITRFELHFNAVSCSGNSDFGVKLGTGGSSVDSSGYLVQSTYVRGSDHVGEANTGGFFSHGLAGASYSSNGIFRCWRIDATQHKWYCEASFTEYGASNHWFYIKGYKTLSGELDIMEIAPESGTFDSGNLRLVTYTD